jgi:AcrR family transcriptional regulator
MKVRRTRRASPALASDEELWGALPPMQLRSVDAIQRLAAAGSALLSERDYESVSVADIAAAAGMSVGAFYTRFPSKEHLVVHLMRGLRDELEAMMQLVMSDAELDGCTIGEVMHRFLTMMADGFVRHRGLIRPASLIARQTTDPQLRELLRRFNEGVHGRLRAILRDRIGSGEGLVTMRIDTAILWTSAAMREVFLYGEPVSALSPRYSSLIDELSRGAELYLTAPRDA